MRARRILNVAFGLLLGSFALYAMFPRLQNGERCDNSVAANAAQQAGLDDARSRKAPVCSGSQMLCVFGIHDDDDGSFRVSLYLMESDFFEGCIFKDQDLDVFVYSRDGKLVGIEGAPYG